MKFNILHTEWSDGWGGQEIRVMLDCLTLTRQGHRVTILTVPGSQIGQRATQAGLRVITRPMRHSFDPLAIIDLARFFRREGFQVVNTHSSVDSWLASAAAKLARVPVLVRTRHLSVPVSTNPFNVVYRWPDGIITTAETIRRRMIEVNGLDGNRIVSIPTGVDLEVFDPALHPGSVRADLGLGPQDRLVTMVAVLRSWKRHETFLDAAAILAPRYPRVRFLIVGEGPRRPEIEAKIDNLNLGLRVVMTGHRPDVPRILAASEIGVLTSESSEGVPQSVLQYQAMTLPVVATAAGGIPEVVQDGVTGLLCPPNEPKTVARALARLLDDRDSARILGRRGRAQVEARHSVEAMIGTTLDFYDRIFRTKTGNRLY